MKRFKSFAGTLAIAALCAMPAVAQSNDSERRAEGARAAKAVESVDRSRFGQVAQLMRNPNRINTALYQSDPSLVGRTMLAAKVAESERLKGSEIVRSTIMMDFMRDLFAAMPGMGGQMMDRMGTNQYEAVWPLTVSVDGRSYEMRVRFPLHPEEVLKIQREAAGISDMQYATMLHGMGAGSMMLGGMGGGAPMGAGVGLGCSNYLSPDVSMDYLLLNPSALMVAQGCMLKAQAEHVATTASRMAEERARDVEDEWRGLALIGEMRVVSATPREVTFAAPRGALEAMSAGAQADGQQLVLHALRVAYDPVTLKELGMQMDGVLTDEAGARDITIETRYSDFRAVEGTALYEPFRQTFSAQGMMTEQERREIARQLPELEKQVASMPASQGQMVPALEKQVGMVRSIADGGPVEMGMVTSGVALNPDIAADGCGMAGGAFVGGLSDLFGGAACQGGGMLGAFAEMFKGGGASGPSAQGAMGAAGAAGAAGAMGQSPQAAGESPEQCLQRLAASKEGVAKKKRGLGGLVNAASRIAGRFGVGQAIADKLGDAYVVSEAGSDLAGAARDLGLTPEEAEVCFNR